MKLVPDPVFTSTMLLSTIAFKFAFGAWLPVLPYLTLFDKKLLAASAYIVLVRLTQFVEARLEVSDTTDGIIGGCCALLFILNELFFAYKINGLGNEASQTAYYLEA